MSETSTSSGKQARRTSGAAIKTSASKRIVWLDLPLELREVVCRFAVQHYSRSHATLVLRTLCKDSRDLVNAAIADVWEEYDKLQHEACVHIRMQTSAHRNVISTQSQNNEVLVQMDERVQKANDALASFARKVFGPALGQIGLWMGGRDVAAFLSALTRCCAFCRRTMNVGDLRPSSSARFLSGLDTSRSQRLDIQCSLGVLCHEQCCKPMVCKLPWQSGFNSSATGHGPSGRLATMMLALSYWEEQKDEGGEVYFVKREDMGWHTNFDNAIETLTVRAKAWRHTVMDATCHSVHSAGDDIHTQRHPNFGWSTARSQLVMLDQQAGLPWRECGLGILGMDSKEDENDLVVKAARVRQWKESRRAVDKSQTRDRRGDKMRQKQRALNNWMKKHSVWKSLRQLQSEHPSATAVLHIDDLHSESISDMKRAVEAFEDIVCPRPFVASIPLPAHVVETACLWSHGFSTAMYEVLQSKAACLAGVACVPGTRSDSSGYPYAMVRCSLLGFAMAPLLLQPCDSSDPSAWFEKLNCFGRPEMFETATSTVDRVPIRALVWVKPVPQFDPSLSLGELIDPHETDPGELADDHLRWNGSMATLVFESSRASAMVVTPSAACATGAGSYRTFTTYSFDKWPQRPLSKARGEWPQRPPADAHEAKKEWAPVPLQIETNLNKMRRLALSLLENETRTDKEREMSERLLLLSERLAANIRGVAPDPVDAGVDASWESADEKDNRLRRMTPTLQQELVDLVHDMWRESLRALMAKPHHKRAAMSARDLVNQGCATSFPLMADAFGFMAQLIAPCSKRHVPHSGRVDHDIGLHDYGWALSRTMAPLSVVDVLKNVRVPLGTLCAAMALGVLRPNRLARCNEELAVSKDRIEKYTSLTKDAAQLAAHLEEDTDA